MLLEGLMLIAQEDLVDAELSGVLHRAHEE